MTDVSPLPNNLEEKRTPFYADSLTWYKQILPRFTLEFEVEGTLESEIVAFFSSIQDVLSEKAMGYEGLPFIFIILILITSLVYLHRVRNTIKK